ncbi:alpha/beta hydrolase [Candidatus Micrarchaeota archaeon]|nr:alpha/beta hydrolase [Candidatus Micrarchaeota archaeon]
MNTSRRIKSYKEWKPINISKNKNIWVRQKEGDIAKPLLVLTHGVLSSGPALNKQFEAFRGYSGPVLALECSGHGISDSLERKKQILDYADEILEVAGRALPFFQPRNTVFLGHCHAGDVAHMLARRQEVAGTVLLNPVLTNSVASFIAFELNFIYRSVRSEIRRMLGRAGKADESQHKDKLPITQYTSSPLRQFFSTLDLFRTMGQKEYGFQLNNRPALLITGEHDALGRPVYVETISKMIPNSEHHILKDCGHMTILVKPEEVARLVIEFVERKAIRY